MELTPIFRTLWERKLALACVTVVALFVAITAGYRVSGFPPKLAPRSIPSGAATAQILVDSPSSALANLKQNPLPLSTRAGVFAQFMASTAVRDSLAATTHLPSSSILTQGPFDDPSMAPSGPTPPDPASVAAGKRYRVTFVAQDQLPIVTVYAQAPDVATARRLADGVAPAVQRYIDRLQTQAQLDQRYRTQIRSLGPAEAGTVKSSPNLKVVAAFIAIMLLGCSAILLIVRLVRRRTVRGGSTVCTFCGAPDAEGVYSEDGFLDAPCCADEVACHARQLQLTA